MHIIRDSTPSQRIRSGMLSQFCREANSKTSLICSFHAELSMHCLQMFKSSIFGQLLWMDIFLSIKVCLSVSLKLIWSLIGYACLWHSCCSKVEEKRRQGKEGISLLLAISGSRFFFFAVSFLTRSSCKERITV